MQSGWIKNKWYDCLFIIGPGLLSTVVVLILSFEGYLPKEVNELTWLFVIVGIDVCHVWSTIFRTYLHKYASREFEKELTLIPLAVWAGSCIIYSFGSHIFWTMMAYLAVYHFIKQQVGITRLYTFKESLSSKLKKEKILYAYLFTIFPVLYWHVTERSFHWFVKKDFFAFHQTKLSHLIHILLLLLFCVFLLRSIYTFKQGQRTLRTDAFLLTTFCVWYVGIVFLNSDWAFSITNVIAHGIPYIALIWYASLVTPYTARWIKMKFFFHKNRRILFFFFLTSLFLLGYIEEFFWDKFVWHERDFVFFNTAKIEVSELTLSWLVPLLSVPQVTHYILDGIIWKKERRIKEFNF